MKMSHGGARKGSGNKPKYGEKTKTISFRVPESLVKPITDYVRKQLLGFKKP